MWFAIAFLVVVVSAFASPTGTPVPLKVDKCAGQTTGRYIIKFKDAAGKANVLARLDPTAIAAVSHQYDTIFYGFAGAFDTATLDALRTNPDVEYIDEDGIVHTTDVVTQTNAPWGLGRLSSVAAFSSGNDSSLTYTYTYDRSAGSGVDIYVVDTGIFTNHSQFGGRARWGATFGGYPSADGNGHGTHVSGTAAGSQFGVAKLANLIAVKVLNDRGAGNWSDVVSGLQWVGNVTSTSGRPSVVSMSLGGGVSQAVDDAVNALAAQGIHVVVAAGNGGTNASTSSPARAAGAITIGAVDISDTMAIFSNYGPSVALFAPGVDVISAWIGNINATHIASGTSMATPHVSGLVAYLIGLQGNITPSAMKAKLQDLSLKGVLNDIPSGTLNDLVHNT